MKLKKTKNRLLIISTVLMTVIYLFWRTFYTIPIEHGVISIVCAIILLVVEILGMFEAAIHFYSMSEIKYPKLPIVEESLFPEVDVFIATYNEPRSLLFKTINGCKNMEYPDKSKVHIYLCDDSNRTEMKELAAYMEINYLNRTDRVGAKAGNLNNALKNSSSPLIVTFDADMIPMHDFLKATVPYFLTHEKVGFVQTPQSFYNPDLFQYYLFSEGRIPNEQDYFYRDVQISRNKTNSVIYGGSNTVLSREALVKIGGFYTKAITEDFATGMIIQSNGYKCYAIDEVHASGLSPEDLPSLVKQRERWARGCIQTGRKLNILFRKGLDIGQKLSYISAISYWYSSLKRLVYIMAPILFTVFGVIVVKCDLVQVLIFWLPMYLLSGAALKQLSGSIRTTKWTNIYETVLFPYMIIPVLLETFCISQTKFKVTRKDGAQDDKKYRLKSSIPHLFFLILSFIGIVNCIKMIFSSGSPAYTVVLFWLVVNAYNILMSVFFMLGRKTIRKSERFPMEEKCTISFDETEIMGSTIDISEQGLSISLDSPEFIPYDIPVKIRVYTEKYSSGFEGKVVYVDHVKDKWKVSFMITNIDESEYKQLLNIDHDRIPTLPRSLDQNTSVFDDLRVNLLNRNKKTFLFNRKLIRVELDKMLIMNESKKIVLVSFNYEYIALKASGVKKLEEKITLNITKDIAINCALENTTKNPKDKSELYLYKIEDYKTLAKNSDFRKILVKWVDEDKNRRLEIIKARKGKAIDEINEMEYL